MKIVQRAWNMKILRSHGDDIGLVTCTTYNMQIYFTRHPCGSNPLPVLQGARRPTKVTLFKLVVDQTYSTTHCVPRRLLILGKLFDYTGVKLDRAE